MAWTQQELETIFNGEYDAIMLAIAGATPVQVQKQDSREFSGNYSDATLTLTFRGMPLSPDGKKGTVVEYIKLADITKISVISINRVERL